MNKGTCKHFSCQGLTRLCAAGQDPDALAQAACAPGEDYKLGLAYRIPCHTREHDLDMFRRHGSKISAGIQRCLDQKAGCPDYAEPTAEEIAAHEAEMDAFMARFKLALPLIERIKREHQTSWSGIEPCPVCGANLTLRLNVFGRHGGTEKHLHGQCLTPGCLSWME